MKNKICFLAILNALCSLPAFAGEYTAEGIRAFRRGDYALAERCYWLAIKEETDPSNLAAIYRNLAILYNARGKDGSAFTKKADELEPPDKQRSFVKSDPVLDRLDHVKPQSASVEKLIEQEQSKAATQMSSPQSSQYLPPTQQSPSLNQPQAQQLSSQQALQNQLNSPQISSQQYQAQPFLQGQVPSQRNNVASFPPQNGISYSASGMSSMISGNASIGLNGFRGGIGGGFRGSSVYGGGYGGYGGGVLNGGYGGNILNGAYAGSDPCGPRINQFPVYPRLGGTYYSSRSPNGTFEYSDSTPVVLPAPNGGAIILNAPGPNIYSSQQAPDGSTTTIMKRTY